MSEFRVLVTGSRTWVDVDPLDFGLFDLAALNRRDAQRVRAYRRRRGWVL